MQILRERHRLSREDLKNLLVQLSEEHDLAHVITWNDFAFMGKAKGTVVQGEVFENELYIEVVGWLEKLAVQKFRAVWKMLAQKELV